MVKKNKTWKMEKTIPMMPVQVPPLLQSIAASLFNSFGGDKSFLTSSLAYKIFQTLRFIILTFYVFLLRFIPSFLFVVEKYDAVKLNLKPHRIYAHDARNDTSIGRALSQLLSSLNDIPVSSRKYEVVRTLAEKIINDNYLDGVHALREVNRVALSAAFGRALRQLEVQVADRWDGEGDLEGDGGEYQKVRRRLRRVVRAVGWRVKGGEGSLSGVPAEKLAAELVWMAKKMVDCDCADEAIFQWAAASNLGFLALSADMRLQSSLVKLAAFLFKEAKDMGPHEILESRKKLCKQTKFKMLQAWLPLLCRANNGTDVPALSIGERAELERVLESIIMDLEQEEQGQVLSLWLHHFTRCSSSDWPNLNTCFASWCTASRKKLLLSIEN